MLSVQRPVSSKKKPHTARLALDNFLAFSHRRQVKYADVLDRVASSQAYCEPVSPDSQEMAAFHRPVAELMTTDVPARVAVRAGVEVFGASFCFIYRYQPEEKAGLIAYWPENPPLTEELLHKVNPFFAGGETASHTWTENRTFVVNDMAGDKINQAWCERALGRMYRSLAVLPLANKQGVFGVMMVCRERDLITPEWLEILELYASHTAMALENERLQQEANWRWQRLSSLSQVYLASTASTDLKLTLSIFLDETLRQLDAGAGNVFLLRPHMQVLELVATRGFRTPAPAHSSPGGGEGLAGRVAAEKKRLLLAQVREHATESYREYLEREGIIGYVGLPLLIRGRLAGVLEFYMRSRCAPDSEWLALAEIIAGQAAIAVDHASLMNDMQRAHADLILAYDATIEGWSRALELRDRETEGHSQRVSELTLKLAAALGLSEEEQAQVRRGTLLHDIGKMAVPDAILLKKGQLTPEEQKVMQQHPTYAGQLLSPIKYLRHALDIPIYHHERWDGTGYPFGLAGEAIPLAARIFAVVDVWDAITSDRPYSKAWPSRKALDHIKAMSGTHFDPQVVAAFLALMESR